MEGENLLLDIFPPEEQNPSHESSLYLDAGDGYGASRQDTFMCKATDQGWSLKWTSDGDYPFPFEQVTLQVHQAEPEELVVDGKPYSLAGGRLQIKPFHKLHAGL
jgi:alpha-glucosidase